MGEPLRGLYGANESHGLRRTNEDKRRAVVTLLNDEEWSGWSNREIARKCGVSDPFVMQIRSSLLTVSSEPRTFTTKHGTVATMNTANIGKPYWRIPPVTPTAVYPGGALGISLVFNYLTLCSEREILLRPDTLHGRPEPWTKALQQVRYSRRPQ
jgi:hypothetical protein